MTAIADYERLLSEVLSRDKHGLEQQLRRLKTSLTAGKPAEELRAQFEKRLDDSRQQLFNRRERKPKPSLDADLPILNHREELNAAIRDHQVVIVAGETGSGKSTQLPQLCLEMGRGVSGLIGHTQPRRIAARTIASRIAQELKVSQGKEVGYKIRFTDSTSADTYIKLMTDGILLAEMQNDRFLSQYDTLIIDEAHERSLNIDFLLGLLKKMLPKRPELKLIITSATIDADRFSEFFKTHGVLAPILNVSGRSYPVDVWYRPPEESKEDDVDWMTSVCDSVQEVCQHGPGDVLIFLPTERDIRELATQLRGRTIAGDYQNRKTEILPLYARLSNAEQNKVFQTGSQRRIVLATNVAESSLTVPGIRYVIDTGLARLSRYSARSKIQRLPIEPVSQASANQRKGRCGRVGPGICVRIYSEADFNSRDEFTTPEIQRSNLASVILQSTANRYGNLETFPFLDPPRPTMIRTGYKTLHELGALDEQQRLTEIGKKLAKLPVDCRIGRMILAGDEENCLHELLIIASALEIQDPRERPVEKQSAADQAHSRFSDENSDFLSYLKLWDAYHKWKTDLSNNQLRKKCLREFVSYNRMREWSEIFRQLSDLVRELGLKRQKRRDDGDAIHRALLCGLLSNIATKSDKYEYLGAGGHPLYLWPGSTLFKKKPKWIMAGELVETTRRFGRTIARIDPNWLERIAGHLIKRSYGPPFWSADRAAPMTDEKSTLFGLTIIPRRPVNLGRVNLEEARHRFIVHGLVEGDMECQATFFKQNQERLQEAEAIQHKLRKYDLLADQQSRYEFFDRQLPDDVCDLPRLNKWLKTAERSNPYVLQYSLNDLIQEDQDSESDKQFPDYLELGQNQFSLEYKLAPGEEDDGITMTVPKAAINQIDRQRLGWLVPGLLEEKVTALIKSLPKQLRRMFVPAPDTAREIMEKLSFGDGELLEQVALNLSRMSGEPITSTDFDVHKIPTHLRINLKVIDQDNTLVKKGETLEELQREVEQTAGSTLFDIDASQWNRSGLTEWPDLDLPEVVEVDHQGMRLKAYPCLTDDGESVSLILVDSPEKRFRLHREGILRLFLLKHHRQIRTQIENFPGLNQIQLLSSSISGMNLREQLTYLLARRALFMNDQLPVTDDQFQALCKQARNRLSVIIQELVDLIGPLVDQYHDVLMMLDRTKLPYLKPIVDDARSQLEHLVQPQMFTDTPFNWLSYYPRYLNGIKYRLEKATTGNHEKDLIQLPHFLPLWDKARKRLESRIGIDDPEFILYRWMIEELRVSIFAQPLGTSQTVSIKRLEKQWKKVRQ
ncbi:ATP-dependent RNA helicase HrpB [Polystyrenella longa]|uniref:ATP-dependent RNA helicase HrpB n=1 Tax=Polystyrenella longa TaxID=2528007 RepID=A0A518CNM5_9PLAN|nr:ATP-dependent RNA helicase HrpA [Polystyrenella longa]QDU80794.1 ATP-dependent RNA helicase HrpB [Polystyrenella longa]